MIFFANWTRNYAWNTCIISQIHLIIWKVHELSFQLLPFCHLIIGLYASSSMAFVPRNLELDRRKVLEGWVMLYLSTFLYIVMNTSSSKKSRWTGSVSAFAFMNPLLLRVAVSFHLIDYFVFDEICTDCQSLMDGIHLGFTHCNVFRWCFYLVIFTVNFQNILEGENVEHSRPSLWRPSKAVWHTVKFLTNPTHLDKFDVFAHCARFVLSLCIT